MAVEHSTLTGNSIAENLQIIKDATVDIKQAIIDKGGNVSGDISTWADAIRGIESGGTSQIKTFSIDGYGKFPYETGMTWGEYFNSDFGHMGYLSLSIPCQPYVGADEVSISATAQSGLSGLLRAEGTTTDILITDVIDTTVANYYVYINICCFAAYTSILMSDNTYKNIQEIKEGDEVMSYDIRNNLFYPTIVKKLIIKENVHTIAKVLFENGEELTMNEYHPILTDSGWHSLTLYNGYDKLVVGDSCKTSSGWSKIISIDRYNSEEGITMYNLDVVDKSENIDIELNDNFIANNIVVHNGFC